MNSERLVLAGVLALGLLALSLVLGADAASEPTLDPAEIWVHANESFDSGDFDAAVRNYDRLVTDGVETPSLYFNLGTALLRAGDLGRAIAALRRASALAPRDPDIQLHLQKARERVVDDVAPPAPSQLQRTLFFWHYTLSRSERLWILSFSSALFWAALMIRWLRPRWEFLLLSAWLCLVPTAMCAGSLLVEGLGGGEVAVILPGEVPALAGMQRDAAVRFVLHAGSEVEAVQALDGWLRVALPDGSEGWLPREDVDIVEP